MAKSSEKAGPIRQIKPPPLSQHLRELASRPHAWAVIARNLIPVVGIYGFGWSAGLTVFNYWLGKVSDTSWRNHRRSGSLLGQSRSVISGKHSGAVMTRCPTIS